MFLFVLIKIRRVHAACDQRIALQIEHLRSVGLRYAHVTDEHVISMSHNRRTGE